MTEEKKSSPCPVCQTPLVLQYDKENPHFTEDPVSLRIRIPMRCTKCGINLEIAVDPEKMEEEDE